MHYTRFLKGCVLGLAAASSPIWAGTFPATLSGNTTGQLDSIFVGPPDDSYVGIGADEVTFDFGPNVVVNRVGLVDLNVYEVDFGAVEFGLMDILVSQDGLGFFSIKSSMTALERTSGDSIHGSNSFGRSFELGAFDWVRYVKIDGTGSGRAGGNNDFDLDAIGAHEVRPIDVSVPEPTSWQMLLGGLLALVSLAHRRGS